VRAFRQASRNVLALCLMQPRRALLTCAGRNQRTLPLQSLVDRDGTTKTALTILIEEVLAAGISEVGVVISPGDESAYRSAAGSARRLAPRRVGSLRRQPLRLDLEPL